MLIIIRCHCSYFIKIFLLIFFFLDFVILYRARGARWEGEREKRSLSFNVLFFPSSPARFLFFDYCFFYWDIQREPLRRREVTNSLCCFVMYLFYAVFFQLCVFNSGGTPLFGTHICLWTERYDSQGLLFEHGIQFHYQTRVSAWILFIGINVCISFCE